MGPIFILKKFSFSKRRIILIGLLTSHWWELRYWSLSVSPFPLCLLRKKGKKRIRHLISNWNAVIVAAAVQPEIYILYFCKGPWSTEILTLKWVVRSGGGVFIFFFFKKELGGVLYTKEEEKMCPGSHDREYELDCSIGVYILL